MGGILMATTKLFWKACAICGFNFPTDKMKCIEVGDDGETRWACWKHVKQLERMKAEDEHYEAIQDYLTCILKFNQRRKENGKRH